jgi:uncharacterized protein with PIN domain
MPHCDACGAHLSRVHRTAIEKLVFADVFRCGRCGRRVRRGHRWARVNLSFYFSTRTRCVRCGSVDVRRAHKLDHVDSVSKHPLSLLQRLLLAPVTRCFACRLQYFDWRPLHPMVKARAEAGDAGQPAPTSRSRTTYDA